FTYLRRSPGSLISLFNTRCSFDVVSNVNSISSRKLLTSADLTLMPGRRYGLVGRNGIGKTTLLKVLSSGQLVIGSNIRVLHVEQEVNAEDTTVLNCVLESDEKRQMLLNEERLIETTNGPLLARLKEIYEEMQACEFDKAPAKAACILHGLGFKLADQNRATKEFSGGWRMRIALARALFVKPDLLLLDEPTNMLDMKALLWLENYLQDWSSTLLTVSHDRCFLNAVATDIIHMHSQRLDYYSGNYDQFAHAREEKSLNQRREYEAQKQFREHVQEFIDRFRYNAKRASLVQSKIKMLEKLPVLQPVEVDSVVHLRFPPCEAVHPPVLQLDEVSFGYVKGSPILEHVNISADMDSRICVVGENGSGKTTLLKIVLGLIEPTEGLRSVNRRLKIAYFSQHHVDQLDLDMSPLTFFQSKFPENILLYANRWVVIIAPGYATVRHRPFASSRFRGPFKQAPSPW
ncbi:unnamed protein product, partial [Soboliphyme baturini]|uniref:ABC transporter domain-containing protein n=1 Tax=Soboliphyme baturini TaxID=241478 RepID=A0A183INB2_9BILA